ncbi:MAG TPA: metallophosphoesterase family protein [Xanthobacteraceae bacterium]|nr:metallophosphoesterase family protein [Xanthobacteraceae bacterium]
MLIALFTDIHSNRQAFTTCLARARGAGAQQIVLLGDYVGYGADPEWTVNTVMELVDRGALAVRGNHDTAVGDSSEMTMNTAAEVAVEWTRRQLGAAERRFLKQLPLTREDADRLYVHADASDPTRWRYVLDALGAERSMAATNAHLTFCGHCHQPALYSMSATGKMTAFTPTTGSPVQILPDQRWLAVLGSVGQPRDGNPAAAYALFDTDRRELTYCRAAYDVAEAAARIRNKGLPDWLADRLLTGQ